MECGIEYGIRCGIAGTHSSVFKVAQFWLRPNTARLHVHNTVIRVACPLLIAQYSIINMNNIITVRNHQ